MQGWLDFFNCYRIIDMVEIGTKVSLAISESWPIDIVITGIIIKSLNSAEYFVIQDSAKNELYLVTPRYKGETLSDIGKGRKVIVGIATPLQELNLLTIPEITPDVYKWLYYSNIGSIEIKEQGLG